MAYQAYIAYWNPSGADAATRRSRHVVVTMHSAKATADAYAVDAGRLAEAREAYGAGAMVVPAAAVAVPPWAIPGSCWYDTAATEIVSSPRAALSVAEIRAALRVLALQFDDEFHAHWPDTTRREDTQAWGEAWIGHVGALVAGAAPSGANVTTARERLPQCQAEIGLGIRTWYSAYDPDAWAPWLRPDPAANFTLYTTNAETGGGSAAVAIANSATWLGWRARYGKILRGDWS